MVSSDFILIGYLLGLFTGVGLAIIIILTYKNSEEDDDEM